MGRSWVAWAAAVVVSGGIGYAAYWSHEHDDEFFRVALPGYLTAFGLLALSGTTVWLSHRERAARRLERSHAAAFGLARSLGTVVESLGRTRGFNRRLDLSAWNLDVATYSGDLSNLEVMRRVNEVTARLIDFDKRNQVGITESGGLPSTADTVELQARRAELGQVLSWLGQSLGAYRAGEKLPAPLSLTLFPTL